MPYPSLFNSNAVSDLFYLVVDALDDVLLVLKNRLEERTRWCAAVRNARTTTGARP